MPGVPSITFLKKSLCQVPGHTRRKEDSTELETIPCTDSDTTGVEGRVDQPHQVQPHSYFTKSKKPPIGHFFAYFYLSWVQFSKKYSLLMFQAWGEKRDDYLSDCTRVVCILWLMTTSTGRRPSQGRAAWYWANHSCPGTVLVTHQNSPTDSTLLSKKQQESSSS